MKTVANQILIIVLICSFLTGCASQSLAAIPVAGSLNQEEMTPTATSEFLQAPGDATATPTPFQPLPPTPVYLPTSTPAPTATALPTATVIAQAGGKKGNGLVQPAGQINILLLGADARPGQKLFRTDTIILATVNPQLGTVNLLSFPRDLYINIPGRGQDRINTPYEYGGWPLLAKTFAYNFGITPDHYVVINFSNFKQLVDSLGGLEINVGANLTDYRYPHGYVTIPKGRVKMDADTILWYVRSRKTTNDLARNHRQQEVLQAIGEKLLSMNAVRRAPEFYSFYKDNVTTDLSFTDMIPFIPLAAGLADGSKLRHYYVGANNVKNWITPGGAMVLLPNMEGIRSVLRRSLNAQ